jgi:hypothetical protein
VQWRDCQHGPVDNLLRTCGKLVRNRWMTLWIVIPSVVIHGPRPAQTSSTGCARQKVGHFLIQGYPQALFTRSNALPVENLCAHSRNRRVFPSDQTDSASSPRTRRTRRPGARRSARARGRPRNKPRPRSSAGYPSAVCSNTGDAIDRIAAAIDQLARDVRNAKDGASEQELTTRVATLWQMISELDPELARRAQRYTGPASGGPSA